MCEPQNRTAVTEAPSVPEDVGDASLAAPLAACTLAFLIYGSLGLTSHFGLRTNAFDLSVFDYAISSFSRGPAMGYVPMFGHSLFAQHFMPSLWLLAPFGRMFESPTYLIVLQTFLHAAAGLVFFQLARRHVSRNLALALLAAFLFSRRSHSAVTSYFYIESAEPLLIFSALFAWSTGRLRLFWLFSALAMGCKEDVALYFLAFGAIQASTASARRLGLALVAVSTAWLIVAFWIALPHWREMYGLTSANPLLEGRYDLAGGLQPILSRVVSLSSLSKIITVSSATAFLCLLAPRWFAIALLGMLANLAALPGTGQAGLIGHYLWPILPWTFVAAIFGAARLPAYRQRWLPAAIALITLANAQLPASLARAPWNYLPKGAEVRAQIDALPLVGVVLAQPNLIPHLPRHPSIYGVGVYQSGQALADYVLLTREGDLWPLDTPEVDRLLTFYQKDPAWEQITHGPLFTFRRR